MSERRSWTEEQDRILKYLKNALQIKKWSQVSRKLQLEYNIYGRTGKQCRERFHNHLDSSIVTKELSSEEERKLFDLHNTIGNRWSMISKQFEGRTDNHLKNHFYSKLRKAMRKINKQSKRFLKKNAKQFKLTLVYKIVEASGYRHELNSSYPKSLCDFFNTFKNTLIEFADADISNEASSHLEYKEKILMIVGQLEKFQKCIKEGKKSSFSQEIYQKSKYSSNQKGGFISPVMTIPTSNESQEVSKEVELDENESERNLFYEEVSSQYNAPEQKAEAQNKDQTQPQESPEMEQEQLTGNSVQENRKSYYSFQQGNIRAEPQHSTPIEASIQDQADIEEGHRSNFKMMSFKSIQSFNYLDDCLLEEVQIDRMPMNMLNSYSSLDASLFE